MGGIAGEGNQAAGSTMNGYKKRKTQKRKARECRLQAGRFYGGIDFREAAGLKKDYLSQADIEKLEAW